MLICVGLFPARMTFNYMSVDNASPRVATHTSPTVATYPSPTVATLYRSTSKRLPAVE
jgi:hypothetical protein